MIRTHAVGNDFELRGKFRMEDGEFPKNFYEETRYVRIPVKD